MLSVFSKSLASWLPPFTQAVDADDNVDNLTGNDSTHA